MDELILKLIEAIKKEYKSKKATNAVFKKLMTETTKARSYENAYDVAKRAGFMMEDSIMESWNEIMGKGSTAYASTIKEVLYKITDDMDADVLEACVNVQKNKNAAAGIGLKPQEAVPNGDELSFIGEQMDGKQIDSIYGELATYAHKVVDLTMQSNMDLAMDVGFKVKVKRKYDGVGLRRGTKHAEKCAYCLERAGSYTFETTNEAGGSGVFARHDGCGCTIDYENEMTGTRETNVQNSRTRRTNR